MEGLGQVRYTVGREYVLRAGRGKKEKKSEEMRGRRVKT